MEYTQNTVNPLALPVGEGCWNFQVISVSLQLSAY